MTSQAMQRMRACAITNSLFSPETLQGAIDMLGFIQADPIRAPARAQDLILRHRVLDYRAGDIESRYPSLEVEEDFLYAYGFVSREVHGLVHPRPHQSALSALEKMTLETVRDRGPVHPKELERRFGRHRVVNSWGGYSRATKQALERLHYAGLLRVARRENGVRVYEAAEQPAGHLEPRERLSELVLLVARVLAPISLSSLRRILARMRRWFAEPVDHRGAIQQLVESGRLASQRLDGVTYAWPASTAMDRSAPPLVRLLAPFDPVVFDRTRFEHFWGWPYRFEAYTPPAKRRRGYYAMPLLWRDQIVGWANASHAGGVMDVELGFAERRPRDPRFRREADAEAARLEAFLAPAPGELAVA